MSIFEQQNEEQLTAEQLETKVAGYLDFIKDKTEEEKQEAFSKQSDELKKLVLAKQLQNAGASQVAENLLNPQVPSNPAPQNPAPAQKPANKTQEEVVDELVNKKLQEAFEQKSVAQDKSDSENRIKSFFGSQLDTFLASPEGTIFVNYINNGVQAGGSYGELTTQALSVFGAKFRQDIATKAVSYEWVSSEGKPLSIHEQWAASMNQAI